MYDCSVGLTSPQGQETTPCCLPQHSGVEHARTRRCQQSEVDLTFPEPMRARSFSACLKPAEFKNSTIIRLLDGSKAYLQAIIDNFSRRVHARRATDAFIRAVTADLLIEAFGGSTRGKPQRLVDGDVERRLKRCCTITTPIRSSAGTAANRTRAQRRVKNRSRRWPASTPRVNTRTR